VRDSAALAASTAVVCKLFEAPVTSAGMVSLTLRGKPARYSTWERAVLLHGHRPLLPKAVTVCRCMGQHELLVVFVLSSCLHSQSSTTRSSFGSLFQSELCTYSASCFNCKYHLLSLESSGSCVRLLPRLTVTSILPSSVPSITCFRRQLLREM